jgi:hypothetical protein
MGPRGKLLRRLLNRGIFDPYIFRIYSAVEERRYTEESSPEIVARVLQLSNLLRIYEPKNKPFVRLGNQFDGGYVIIDTLGTLDSVLSLGVGTDVSFELDLSEHVGKIDLYDYTVDSLPVEIRGASFFKLGVCGSAQPGFITLVEALGSFDKKDNVLLKMDIEYSEWDVLLHSPVGLLSRFQQIVIEFHGLLEITSEQRGKEIISSLRRINETHKLVHLHVNNYEPVRIVGGVPIPNVVEATYLRSDESEFIELPRPRGAQLNFPNNPNKLDISAKISF